MKIRQFYGNIIIKARLREIFWKLKENTEYEIGLSISNTSITKRKHTQLILLKERYVKEARYNLLDSKQKSFLEYGTGLIFSSFWKMLKYLYLGFRNHFLLFSL